MDLCQGSTLDLDLDLPNIVHECETYFEGILSKGIFSTINKIQAEFEVFFLYKHQERLLVNFLSDSSIR